MGPEAAGGDPLPRPVSPPAVFEGQVRPQASALRCGDRAEGTPGVLLVSMTASCKNDPELVQKALCPSAIVTGASFNSYPPPPPNTHMHQGVLNNSRPGLQTCSVQGQLADTTLPATEPQLSPLTPQVRLESLRTNNKQVGAAGFPQNRQVRSECLENYNATQ